MIERVPHRAWCFFRDDMVGADNYDPNDPVTVKRYVRCIPVAGAADYPVVCNLSNGKQVWFFGPDFQDIGQGQRISVVPRGFVATWSPTGMPVRGGLGTSEARVKPAPFETLAPPKPGAPRVPSGHVGNSGYISGDYVFQTTDSEKEVLLAQTPPRPSGPWLAGFTDTAVPSATAVPLDTVVAALTAPFLLPDYAPKYTTALAGAGAGYFLGCGARVVRWVCKDAKAGGGSTFPVTLQKRQVSAFSQVPEQAGVLTFDTADSIVIEETINIDVPLWMYIGAPPAGGTGSLYSLDVYVSRQPTW